MARRTSGGSRSVGAAAAAAKRHGGRPTIAEAKRRQELLLDVAGTMFMTLGYDGASIDAVAEAAGMSKRTVYAHYADKSALFSAVLRQLIDRWLAPICRFEASRDALDATLMEIGRHLLSSTLEPSAVRVHRIIVAEAERQPGFGRLADTEGGKRAVRAIAIVLQRHRQDLRLADLETAAAQFMSLVIDHYLRLACLGVETGAQDIEGCVRTAVDLFLNGALRR